MKRILACMLALVLTVSLCACGGKSFTETDIEMAMEDCKGTLNVEKSGNKVEGFNFVVDADYVDAENRTNMEYYEEAILLITNNDLDHLYNGHIQVANAFSAMASVLGLLGETKGDDVETGLAKILGVLCTGKTLKTKGWSVSAVTDATAETITIIVK